MNCPNDSNRDYLETNNHCQQMMEHCLDTIVMLNDPSDGSSAILFKDPAATEKFDSHILMQREVLF